MQIIFLISLLAFAVNLPAGYLRSRSVKYSIKWFAYIHLPIPLIAAVRIFSQIEYVYIPIFVAAAFAGQFFGGRIERSGC
ncbi:MAG: hypothetical protein RBT37_02375 [Dissulfurispiraceae bacterium]|jgi:hypothetical protein|nr:hypothetical protein [Dissulfurispiraceae bacterium]